MKAWNYLSGWTSFTLPNNIQKRLYKFVLRRAIGQFLQNELDLENFDIALINGNLELRDLDLNLEFINKLLIDTPFILEKGSVASINASIPWSKLLSGDITLRIIGLHISLRPIKNKAKDDLNPSTPIEEQIMSSSLHFADDFLRTEIEKEQTEELRKSIQESFNNSQEQVDMEGLQVLTKVIDKMMSRVKVDILDTIIRINHNSTIQLSNLFDQSNQEYHVDICIPRISYFDETPEFNNNTINIDLNESHHLMESSILIPPIANETIKIITIASPEIWLRSDNSIHLNRSIYSIPTKSETTINDESDIDLSDDLAQTEFFDTEEIHSSLFQSDIHLTGSITPKPIQSNHNINNNNKPYEALLFTTLDEKNWIRFKLRPSIDSLSFTAVKQIDFLMTRIRSIITPQQVAFFIDLFDTISSITNTTPIKSTLSNPSNSQPHSILNDLDTFNLSHDFNLKSNLSIHPTISPNININQIVPDRKIKVQMTQVELFIMADDTPVTNGFEVGQDKTRNHLLFCMKNIHIRNQIFPKQHHPSTTDIRISNISLDEWILKPPHLKFLPFSYSRSQTQYNIYNPIFQFDNRIKSSYSDFDHFPAYQPKSQSPDQSDAFKIKIEKRQSRDPGLFTEGTSFEEDITVDIPAFKLTIDPRILDRFDQYILAIQNIKSDETPLASEDAKSSSVFDDLQSFENTQKRKVKVKSSFIRVIVLVPDMSQTSTRDEFNDQFHESQLSIDIKKVVGTWSSITTVLEEPSRPSSFDKHEFRSRSKRNQTQPLKKPNKINIELAYVNVFMLLKQDTWARCWFTSKTIQSSNKVFTENTLSPSIEITIQDLKSILPSNPARSGYFGSGSDIPNNLFDFLNRNESFCGEQKFHIPMDEQSESALIFKQRTIETSRFVVNCHFPQADMNLTKSVWDKVQIIQNDLLLWQPRFLLSKSNPDLASSDYHLFSQNEVRSTSSIMSQSHERLPCFEDQKTSPTLFSIIAVMSNGIWDINTSKDHTYRLQFSEFKYFAAIKHLGQDENITTLDIEELDVYDISNRNNHVLLLYKTIPKSIHPKCNTSMISLFSRLNAFPESNKIDKTTSVVACNLCWKATFDVSFVDQIVEFQKVPEEMVFIDPPTQYIKVFAHILETSIDYEPIYSPSRAVFVLDGIEVITNVLAGQPLIEIKVFLQTLDVLLLDDRGEIKTTQALEGKTSDSRQYWSTMGFVHTLSTQNVELKVKLKLDDHLAVPKVDVALVSTDISFDTHADSFQTFLNLITFAVNNGDQTIPLGTKRPKPVPKKKTPVPQTTHNILASLDESAFKVSPDQISPPTLIDLPEIEDFSLVEEFYQTSKRPPTKPRRNKHRSKPSEDIIRVLLSQDETPRFEIQEDFFRLGKKVQLARSVVDLTQAELSLRITNANIRWTLLSGHAWDYLRSNEEESTDDIQIKLESISVDFDLMPEQHETAFYFGWTIKEVEVIDNIKTSAWRKFLGYMKSAQEQREADACLVDLELISLRPVRQDPQQEFRLKVKLLPIRLYVDQDALNFLQKFFLFDKSSLRSTEAANASIPKEDDSASDTSDEDESGLANTKDSSGVFFQHVDIYPITLKVDYKPKVFSLGNFREGQVIELMNIFRLDGSEVCLNQVKFTGVNGIDSLLDKLGQEWLPHILNTQKINMVSGVSPVRSIVNLSTGVADLVLLPIQQYRKDGRIIKGIQKGTSSFARATAIEAIKLSSRVATGTQVILEHADGFFSPTDSSGPSSSSEQHFVYTDMDGFDVTGDDDIFNSGKINCSTKPPLSNVSYESQDDHLPRRSFSSSSNDLTEGIQYAYQNISKNLGSAAQTIFAVPTEIQTKDQPHDQDYFYGSSQESSHSSASHNTKAVIRAVPVAVIKPMIGLTSAFQSILSGLRNSIDPVMRLQSEDKYKKPK